MLKIAIIVSIIVAMIVKTSNRIQKIKEGFWIPSKPESIVGCPLQVPYRYTQGGLSYRLIGEHSSGLPTRADVYNLLSCGGPPKPKSRNFPGTSVLRNPHRAGIGVDITNKLSTSYINPVLLNSNRWSDYKLNELMEPASTGNWYDL